MFSIESYKSNAQGLISLIEKSFIYGNNYQLLFTYDYE